MWTKKSIKQNFVWVIRLQVEGSPIFGVDRRGMTFSRKFVSSTYESDRYSILKEVSPPLSCFHGGHGFESKKLNVENSFPKEFALAKIWTHI